MSEEYFSSRDIYLASTLVSLGFKVEGTDVEQIGVNPRLISYWKFKDSPELREAKRMYASSELLVEPKLLFSTMQALKAECMNESRNISMRA
jgi:hypothetical protein